MDRVTELPTMGRQSWPHQSVDDILSVLLLVLVIILRQDDGHAALFPRHPCSLQLGAQAVGGLPPQHTPKAGQQPAVTFGPMSFVLLTGDHLSYLSPCPV